MNKDELRVLIRDFLSTTRGSNFHDHLEKLLDDLMLKHRQALRPIYVTLAEIGVAIIDQAEDTIWITDSETCVERIFNELALDFHDDLRYQLKDFIKIGENESWPEKLAETKNEKQPQLELNLKDDN